MSLRASGRRGRGQSSSCRGQTPRSVRSRHRAFFVATSPNATARAAIPQAASESCGRRPVPGQEPRSDPVYRIPPVDSRPWRGTIVRHPGTFVRTDPETKLTNEDAGQPLLNTNERELDVDAEGHDARLYPVEKDDGLWQWGFANADEHPDAVPLVKTLPEEPMTG
ncbi:hypothetical protein CTA2_12341 [Colletotrichum tanaceti]|nr:hypothetical protein CTA2_12341 [Colletotrichum tanaceti]